MASTQFKQITFGNVVKAEDFQQLSNNIQYVYENMPTVFYNLNGSVKKSSGCKILAGTVNIAPKVVPSWGFGVYFGSFFSEGCHPIVTANIMTNVQTKILMNIYGLDKTRTPDSKGFVANCIADNNTKVNQLPGNGFTVSYIAIGY